jgi:hypothetical protein
MNADALIRNAVDHLVSVDVLPFLFYVTTHSCVVPSWGTGSDCCVEIRCSRVYSVTKTGYDTVCLCRFSQSCKVLGEAGRNFRNNRCGVSYWAWSYQYPGP